MPAAEVEAVLAALSTDGWVAHGSVVVVERADVGAGAGWPDGLAAVAAIAATATPAWSWPSGSEIAL